MLFDVLEILEIDTVTIFQDGPLVQCRMLCIWKIKEWQSKWDLTLHNPAELLVVVIILIKCFIPNQEHLQCRKMQNDT